MKILSEFMSMPKGVRLCVVGLWALSLLAGAGIVAVVRFFVALFGAR